MLTVEQSRAARGLLGWTQQDLADASGLSKTAINNFEKKNSDIKADSLRSVRLAFESMGIEFLEDNGLRLHKDRSYIFRGDAGYGVVISDITHALSIDEADNILRVLNADNAHVELLKTLGRSGMNIRILTTKNVTQDVGIHNLALTATPYESETAPTIFIYAGKIAIELEHKSYMLMIDSQDAYNIERDRFERLWAIYSTASNTTNRQKA